MAQRLVRAKRKIAAARHPVPRARRDELPERLRGVLRRRLPRLQRGLRGARPATALVRGGPLRRGDPPRPAAGRAAARRRRGPRPAGADAAARTRAAARASTPPARYVALDRPGPRALGPRPRSPRAPRCSTARCACGAPGPYQLQAAIAALHATAPTPRRPTGPRSPPSTPSSTAARRRRSSRVNRAAALAFAGRPRPGWSCSARCRRPAPARLRAAARRPRRAAAPRRRRADAADAAYDARDRGTANAVERAELAAPPRARV